MSFMKRTIVIAIVIISYIVTMVVMYFGVNCYVKKKDNRLRNELNSFLKENEFKKYIDIYCYGHKIKFERIRIPTKYVPADGSIDRFFWNSEEYNEHYYDNYNDIIKLYKIGTAKGYCDNGWHLIETTIYDDRISERKLYPYAVGEKETDFQYIDYKLDIQEAIENAFDFCKNKSSDISKHFEEGSYEKVWKDIHKVENEYYQFEKDSDLAIIPDSYPLFECYPYDGKKDPSQAGCLQNGLYKVYLATSPYTTYGIKKYCWNPDIEEREKLHKIWSIILTIIMLSITIPLGISNAKHRRISKETLYEKLKRLCNPSKFTKEYDTEKVSKANSLYKRLMELSPNDSEALFELQEQAVSDLGISLLDKEQVFELKKKVNPEKYMEPYDADKVDLANELYAILTKKDLTYSEYLYVEQKAKKL